MNTAKRPRKAGAGRRHAAFRGRTSRASRGQAGGSQARSSPLAGKRIVLGVSGSIAAAMAPALSHRLVAAGATVQPVLTPAATGIVLPAAFQLAGCEPAVTSLSGKGEHVRELIAPAHLLLLAPATANTLGKLAHGIDDSPVTTFFTTLAGMVPVIVAPAMHASMHANPAVQEALRLLRARGVTVLAPRVDEDAAKMAALEEIVAHAERALSAGLLAGRRVLVIAGSTAEPLGEGIVLTNSASGATGIALASEAFRERAHVELWLGWTELAPPSWIPARSFESVEDLVTMTPSVAGFDVVLVPAAIGDYRLVPGAKVQSGSVALAPTPRVVDEVRKRFSGALVCWKAESRVDDDELAARAQELRKRVGAALVVANRIEDVTPEGTRALLVTASGVQGFSGSRDALAARLVERLGSLPTQ